jgi:hypothetical protein
MIAKCRFTNASRAKRDATKCATIFSSPCARVYMHEREMVCIRARVARKNICRSWLVVREAPTYTSDIITPNTTHVRAACARAQCSILDERQVGHGRNECVARGCSITTIGVDPAQAATLPYDASGHGTTVGSSPRAERATTARGANGAMPQPARLTRERARHLDARRQEYEPGDGMRTEICGAQWECRGTRGTLPRDTRKSLSRRWPTLAQDREPRRTPGTSQDAPRGHVWATAGKGERVGTSLRDKGLAARTDRVSVRQTREKQNDLDPRPRP